MAVHREELRGKANVGERFSRDGRYYQIVKVIRHEYWTLDLIHDLDEFGREPGWYSEVEVEAVEPNTEEKARNIAKAQEKAERQAKAMAAQAAYEQEREAIERMLAELVAKHQLEHVKPNSSVLADAQREVLGWAARPGYGISQVTELAIFRDTDGNVLAVSCGSPVDRGPSYYLSATARAASERKARVWQWWNPDYYHADSYPGPKIPVEELSEEERAEVAIREQARMDKIRADQIRTIEICARGELEREGLVIPEEKRLDEPKRRPVKALSWSVELDPDFEQYLIAYAAYNRSGGEHPTLRVRIDLVLPAGAFVKRGRKSAEIDNLPREIRLHNFLQADLRYRPEA